MELLNWKRNVVWVAKCASLPALIRALPILKRWARVSSVINVVVILSVCFSAPQELSPFKISLPLLKTCGRDLTSYLPVFPHVRVALLSWPCDSSAK
jgi:hypothetical protein